MLDRWGGDDESKAEYEGAADAMLRVLVEHVDMRQVREQINRAVCSDWPNFQKVELAMAVVAETLAARDAAVEREQNLHQVVTEWHGRAKRAEAEIQRLAAARLVLAVFGVPDDAPQPFSLCRDTEIVGLGVQWPGGAVTIKWTPPERLATVTSHSLEDALAVADFPDGTLGVVWLSEDLGTLAEAEERAIRAKAELAAAVERAEEAEGYRELAADECDKAVRDVSVLGADLAAARMQVRVRDARLDQVRAARDSWRRNLAVPDSDLFAAVSAALDAPARPGGEAR
jgi:hypothetical protein